MEIVCLKCLEIGMLKTKVSWSEVNFTKSG
jgi:hypothetical protein